MNFRYLLLQYRTTSYVSPREALHGRKVVRNSYSSLLQEWNIGMLKSRHKIERLLSAFETEIN